MLGLRFAFLMVALVTAPVLADVCPEKCVCKTTRDGLHRATCSNITELYKFTVRQKHHNINILDLSHNNITKLSYELDRLTEVVTLDLSNNGITTLNKFLNNAKKLVHLDLSHNRMKNLLVSLLPHSISSLDLSYNQLTDVPYNLDALKGLEHLELEGNPLHCSCLNLEARDHLLKAKVFIDKAICMSPPKFKGLSWLSLKTKELCKKSDHFDIMMGDQSEDAELIGLETSALKSSQSLQENDLQDGVVIHDNNKIEDDDNLEFIKVNHPVTHNSLSNIEGSGDSENVSEDSIIGKNFAGKMSSSEIDFTTDSIEGSGFDGIEGSGFGINEEIIHDVVTSTSNYELYTGPIVPLITDDNSNFDYSTHVPPTLYAGGPNWHSESVEPELTKKIEMPILASAPTQATRDTTISEHIRVTEAADTENITTHKTGTYVCVALIVIILVCLIGFAIVKSQIRKRRDQRMLRQQKKDVEQASKELVDMNQSLLGKPAIIDSPLEKKMNGRYELVPTHEKKNNENGDVPNGKKHNEVNGLRGGSPRDNNQNKSSSRDNNLLDDAKIQNSPLETSFDSSNGSKKDTHSLSSEEIPIQDDEPSKSNDNIGELEALASEALLNGQNSLDPDFLLPREYVPVYSPDMGRVRIKLTETPKPKTPVLVNRSRSNAGDIIITPTHDENIPNSTT